MKTEKSNDEKAKHSKAINWNEEMWFYGQWSFDEPVFSNDCYQWSKIYINEMIHLYFIKIYIICYVLVSTLESLQSFIRRWSAAPFDVFLSASSKKHWYQIAENIWFILEKFWNPIFLFHLDINLNKTIFRIRTQEIVFFPRKCEGDNGFGGSQSNVTVDWIIFQLKHELMKSLMPY